VADATRTPREIQGLREVNENVVYPHVFQNTDREVGGVLVGRVAPGSGPPVIAGAIPALAADERRATLTFTQDAWEHVHNVLDRQFPNQQIVGWYHSHPGFGIFLSEHDLFIHRNFFSGPAQIALVVDPVAGTEGVFFWKGGEIAPLFERPTPSPWRAAGNGPPGRIVVTAPPPSRRYPLVPLLLVGVIGLAFGLLIARLTFSGDDETVRPEPTVTAAPTVQRAPPPTDPTTDAPTGERPR
jgi:proteasome lid subunit RPN8/RPN11